jgi:16S rRNA (cytosine1402-N4)-methyltransferase
MRFGPGAATTAAEIVNTADESELADLLFRYGEERHARRIARAIVEARREAPITTTLRLAEVVRSRVPRDPSGIDRATRSFQALRLRVNDELGEVERGLEAAAALLAPGGRLVVVDLAAHGDERLRAERAHRRLGFADAEMAAWMAELRLSPEPPIRLPGAGLTVVIWSARRPAAAGDESDNPGRREAA